MRQAYDLLRGEREPAGCHVHNSPGSARRRRLTAKNAEINRSRPDPRRRSHREICGWVFWMSGSSSLVPCQV